MLIVAQHETNAPHTLLELLIIRKGTKYMGMLIILKSVFVLCFSTYYALRLQHTIINNMTGLSMLQTNC